MKLSASPTHPPGPSGLAPVSLSPLARYRWAVAARCVLGAGGSYLLAASWAACMSLLFVKAGMARMEAVTAATMLSFVVYACAALWVFATPRLGKACIGLAVPTLVLAIGAWMLRGAA